MNPVHEFGGDYWRWGVCSHTASVRSRVAFADRFVVLGRQQRFHCNAVGEGENRDFLTCQKFFDDDSDIVTAEFASENGVDGAVSHFDGGGNGDSFA